MRDERRPVRCAIYTRQSVTRPDTTDLSSCAVQRELCEEFVAARRLEGWLALPERFYDEGVSGSTLEGPALDRLLERIEEGGVDRVVIYRLDRITRSLRDWVKLAETLKRNNVSMSATTGEGLEGERDALVQRMANVIATFAEFERDLISERLRDAKAAKRQRGLRSGGLVPYGFVAARDTRQLTPVPAERELVRQMSERGCQCPETVFDDVVIGRPTVFPGPDACSAVAHRPTPARLPRGC
jgi:site-specific DNA recombinase